MGPVERTLTIPSPADRVWEEIVEGSWLGDEVELDATQGGEGRVREGAEIRHVVVESAEHGHRLVFRWWVLDDDGVGAATRVTITLEHDEQDAATQVHIVEAPVLQTVPLPPSGPLAMAGVEMPAS